MCSPDGGAPAGCYRLQETPTIGYSQRSDWKVRYSGATPIFTLPNKLDGRSRHTASFAERVSKARLSVRLGPLPKFAACFLARWQVGTLNAASRRESVAPCIACLVRLLLSQALPISFARMPASAERQHG